MTNALSRTDARTIIEAHPRRTLVVRFTKRTTGTLRRMVCVHFPEHAERATFRFNPAAKGLIAVWDVEKGARRFVNLDGVQSVKASGRHLTPERIAPDERRAGDRPPEAPARKRREAPSRVAPKETPEEEEPQPPEPGQGQGQGWHFEDLEQADREAAALFDTFTI